MQGKLCLVLRNGKLPRIFEIAAKGQRGPMNTVGRLFQHLAYGSLFLLVAIRAQAADGRAYLHGPSLSGSVSVKSWKALRDERVVKQDLDYSCGAASLATLLNEHYGQSLTEQDLLRAMDTGDFMSSFEDIQRALPQFGFRAIGVAASYEQLTKLNVPVIVYLEHRKTEHFSVLRGIDESTVWLADPSQGNRTYSRSQFLAMWDTRDGTLEGKVLLVFLGKSGPATATDFFTKTPRRQTALAVERLRALPDRNTVMMRDRQLWP